MPMIAHACCCKQSKVRNATEYIHAIRDAAEEQKGMKGLEGRKKREKNAGREPHATTKGTRAPTQPSPGMESKTVKNRRQQKKRKSMNKQEGRRKPRRRGDEIENGRGGIHDTPPTPRTQTHRNHHPRPPNTASFLQGAPATEEEIAPEEAKSTTNYTGTETE